jgi:hypothetical protein
VSHTISTHDGHSILVQDIMLQGRVCITHHHLPQIDEAMLKVIERILSGIRLSTGHGFSACYIKLNLDGAAQGVKAMNCVKGTNSEVNCVVSDFLGEEAIVLWD